MKTVFLVDESTTFVQYLSIIIKRLGYQTVSATRVCDCLGEVRAKKPDMVICETSLSEGGGLELCRQIKDSPETKETHVVVVTTDGSEATREAAMQSGASDFLTKPVTMRAVFNVLEHHIGFRRRKHVRTPYVTAVRVERSGREPEELETATLGEGGMFLRCDAPDPKGSVLDLRFALHASHASFKVKGEVVYRFSREGGHPAPGMGVRFVELDSRQRFLLSRHIEHHVTGALERELQVSSRV